jgi:hypothetical protein
MPELADQADRLTGNSLYDLKPAEEMLGFKAKHTWRLALEEEGIAVDFLETA